MAQYTYLGAGSVVTAHHPEPDYTWNLATGSGATRYAGLDTFDRTLTCLWQGDVSGTPDDVVHLAYQYDRASNRINRQDLVSKNLGTAVYRDEVYEYDGLDRLVDVQRGELSGGSITGLNFRQNWADPSTADTALDPTGNWTDFRQDSDGVSSYDLIQTRSHNKENEITDIDATSGGSWVDPLHDAVGNMTRLPRVAAPSSNYLLTYDAWNRVVKIETGAGSPVPIGDYSYDGLHRRVSRAMYVSGTPSFSRRMYYSDNWQVLEERQEDDSEWLLNKQYVWGIRYIDELVLRDQDTTNPPNGTLNQRHYALQDANFNVVAIIGSTGSVVRRYSYDAYGHSITLEADYSLGAYEYDFEYRYAGYRWDYETYLLQVRNRWYHPRLGRWVSRDPVFANLNTYLYASAGPLNYVDPLGLLKVETAKTIVQAFHTQVGKGNTVFPAEFRPHLCVEKFLSSLGDAAILAGAEQLAIDIATAPGAALAPGGKMVKIATKVIIDGLTGYYTGEVPNAESRIDQLVGVLTKLLPADKVSRAALETLAGNLLKNELTKGASCQSVSSMYKGNLKGAGKRIECVYIVCANSTIEGFFRNEKVGKWTLAGFCKYHCKMDSERRVECPCGCTDDKGISFNVFGTGTGFKVNNLGGRNDRLDWSHDFIPGSC